MYELIDDRTVLDVAQDTAKGQYNWNDLNRVEAATEEIAGLLLSLGYHVGLEPTKKDWSRADFPTAAQMNRYLGNVKKVLAAYYAMPGAPVLPASMGQLTWQSANAIERNLRDVETLLAQMLSALRYSGTFVAGGPGLVPTKFTVSGR